MNWSHLLEYAHSLPTIPAGPLLLIKVTLLLALAWLLDLMLARANPRWRVLLWRGVIIMLISLPLLHWIGPRIQLRVVQPVPVRSLPEIQAVAPLENSLTPPALLPAQTVSQKSVPALPPLRPARSTIQMVWIMVTFLWLAGISLLFVRRAVGWRQLRRLAREAIHAPKSLMTAAAKIAADFGCRSVDVKLSAAVSVPFLTGWREPILLLPARMAASESTGQWPAILAHELSHVRSGDLFWTHLASTVNTLLWFHPLAWLARRAHTAACEEVSDAVSAAYIGDAAAYSRTLARVAVELAQLPAPAGGLAMARGPEIMHRLACLRRRLFANPLSRKAVLIFILTLGLVAVLLSGLRFAYAQQDYSNSTTTRIESNKSLPSISLPLSSNRTSVDFFGTEITYEKLATLKDIPSLRRVSFQFTHVTDDQLRFLIGLTLDEVDLHGADKISDVGLVHLGKLKGLKDLDLSAEHASHVITDAGLAHLANLTTLQKLVLINNPITDEGLNSLQNMHALKVLFLEGSKVTDKGIESICKITALRTVSLDHTNISDEGIKQLVTALPDLEQLYLKDCDRISDQSALEIANLKSLNRLTITGKGITDQGLKSLATLPRLKHLYISHASLTDSGLAELAPLQTLRELGIQYAPITDKGVTRLASLQKLEEINLDGTSVTNATITHLNALPNLKSLWLQFTQINDECIPAIKNLIPPLEWLTVYESKISVAGLNQLKTLFPEGHLSPEPPKTDVDEKQPVITATQLTKLAPSQVSGYVYDPAGKPIPGAIIQIREKAKPGQSAIMAPNLTTDAQGHYFYGQIKWPYLVYCQFYEDIGLGIGRRYQYMRLNKVLSGTQEVNFRFEKFPAGKSILNGHVTESNGELIKKFVAKGNSAYDDNDFSQPYNHWFGFEVHNSIREEGFFQLEIPPGKYTFLIEPENAWPYYNVQWTNFAVSGEKTDINFPVARKKIYWGRVAIGEDLTTATNILATPELKLTINKEIRGEDVMSGIGEAGDDAYFPLYFSPKESDQLKSGASELKLYLTNRKTGNGKYLNSFPFTDLGSSRETAGIIKVNAAAFDEAKKSPNLSNHEDSPAQPHPDESRTADVLGHDDKAWKDIPILLELAKSTEQLKTESIIDGKKVHQRIPSSVASSRGQAEARVGMVALWQIERLRRREIKMPGAGPLNPFCIKGSSEQSRDLKEFEGSEEIHQEVLAAYQKWWSKAVALSPIEAARLDPLSGTDLYWYGTESRSEHQTNNSANPDQTTSSSLHWRKKFDEVYRLADGENLKRIPLLFIPERAAYFDNYNAANNSKNLPPSEAQFLWDDKLSLGVQRMGGGKPPNYPEPASLEEVLNTFLELKHFEFEGSRELLEIKIPGDWIIRRTATPDQRVKALENILQTQMGQKITFEKQRVEREVVVTNGEFTYHRLPKAPDDSYDQAIYVYVDEHVLAPGKWISNSGGSTVGELLAQLGDRVGLRFIHESPSQETPSLRYKILVYDTPHSRIAPQPNDLRKANREIPNDPSAALDLLLENVSRQTSLQFKRERRPVEIWFITRK